MQKMSIRSLLFFIKLKCWKIFSVVYIFARQWKKKKKVEISPSSLPINLFTPYYVNEPHFHTASACLKLPDKVAHSILCLTLSSITSHWTINQLVLPLLSPSLPFPSPLETARTCSDQISQFSSFSYCSRILASPKILRRRALTPACRRRRGPPTTLHRRPHGAATLLLNQWTA